jgi:WD40 repeat protein
VYSLGLTLYELLAMRPAFDETNRHKLVSQVMHQSPPRLRDVDRHIPRDLETIVDKAIDREPSRRYQTAAALTDDLKRYLEGMPIHARRTSPVVRFARWARRSPAAATLSAVLTLLAIISPALTLYFGHLMLQAKESHRVAQRRLYEAKRSEARASRFSGRPGQQLNTLASLATAAELHWELEIDVQEVDRMRGEAISVLALPDLSVERSWAAAQPGKTSLIHFDADLEIYTVWDGAALSVRRVEDDAEVARLPISQWCEKARFSPNGRLISVTNAQDRGSLEVQVWDWRRCEIVYRVPKKGTLFATDFSPDSRLLAVGHDDASVSIYDLNRGEEIDSFAVASAPITLGFHPTEPRLAVNCQTAYCTEIWDLARRRLVKTLAHPSDVFSLQWDPQGRLLAVVAGFDIHLWDLDSNSDVPLRIFEGHTWVVSEIQFHPNGRLMYSHCWREGKTRVWDTVHGQQYFWCEGFHSRFSRDGRRLAFRTMDQVGIWSVASGEAYIWPPSGGETVRSADHCHYSPDGCLLASAGGQGVNIWNTSSWRLLAHVPTLAHSVCFDDAGATLSAAHEAGLLRYPLECDQSTLRLGTPEEIPLPNGVFAHHIARSADGESLVVDLLMQPDMTPTGKAALVNRGRDGWQILEGDTSLRFTAMSPDGRWAATGNWLGDDVTIWDVASGKQVHRLDTAGSSVVAFSPDGKQLVTVSASELSFWQVDGWTRLHSLQRSAEVGAVAFSADSRVVAATMNSSQIRLIDAQSGRALATLATNDGPAYVRWLAFRPDGRQLAVCCASEGVRVWDLQALREGLRRIGLDWHQD